MEFTTVKSDGMPSTPSFPDIGRPTFGLAFVSCVRVRVWVIDGDNDIDAVVSHSVCILSSGSNSVYCDLVFVSIGDMLDPTSVGRVQSSVYIDIHISEDEHGHTLYHITRPDIRAQPTKI